MTFYKFYKFISITIECLMFLCQYDRPFVRTVYEVFVQQLFNLSCFVNSRNPSLKILIQTINCFSKPNGTWRIIFVGREITVDDTTGKSVHGEVIKVKCFKGDLLFDWECYLQFIVIQVVINIMLYPSMYIHEAILT